MSIKVILADDHGVVRDGIKAFIDRKGEDIKIIGEASNGEKVLEMAESSPADVYIIDVAMPTLDGIEVTKRLREVDPGCKIIILSMYDDRTFVEKALKYGANGYILKEEAAEAIIRAIHEVCMNKYYLSPGISKFLVQGFLRTRDHSKQNKTMTTLTRREREILQLIAEGSTNKEIARRLNISVNTVLVHRSNIMKKLDIHKESDLIRYAFREGIAHP
jgi:two-component system NarL family response regulator